MRRCGGAIVVTVCLLFFAFGVPLSASEEHGTPSIEFKPITHGSIHSENGTLQTQGDILVRSNGIREIYGVSGRGMRVGVIGNGVESINISKQKGELPEVKVLSIGTGDEGTAMLEIIHDIVPDAELSFHAYGNGSATFKDAVTALAESGCNIICDDLYFFKQPFFQEGDVAEHIRKTLASHPNLIYVTVSGNFATLHYQGSYAVSNLSWDQHPLHAFTPGDSFINITLPAGSRIITTLQWDDPWDAAVHDYDLILFDHATGTQLASSTYNQSLIHNPFEHMVYQVNGSEPQRVDLGIVRMDSTNGSNTLECFIRDVDPSLVEDSIIKNPYDSIFGHASLPEVVTVGSVEPEEPYTIAPDSSQGTVTIRYPSEGKRWKPDICAPTNVRVSGAGNFPTTFPGTSAAAPHVAAVIAQLWSAFPNIPRENLIKVIYSTSRDLGAKGWDETYGYGLIDAEAAYDALNDEQRSGATRTSLFS